MNNPFKVGDKVRAIDNAQHYFDFKIGATGVVCEAITDRVKVIFDSSDDNWDGWMYPSRFELIKDVRIMEEDLALARTFLNKDVISCQGGNKFTVKSIRLFVKEDDSIRKSTEAVKREVEKHGFCVALIGSIYEIPVSNAIAPPTSKTVKLNDTYDAVVSKDTITVGCQTFPIGKLRELQEAFESL